ncbi:50S ribosomal protein L10 [Buchnera aphidicola]|uniref:Large ribosomal subunit protein uL10 n=1 Tax=Buchnera aphidicola subsp. Cinara cedri (strain Cc) TaxID=372461 RepID=RL10_BUCCC|nr:50S ribosomal protein L10 [Buchnera aphidicola]Q058E3.1 RecName: Full=Large ribosomal subunit protein uL10; AltName: Full=50S ribosomal protein L10 [Buchnera aphidicola BCc]ABJ90506.1 50S ribosomal protein L10 [Buchnera aphidicola BCc]
MALNRNKKKKIIKKINNVANKSLSIITANPSKITVNIINKLRKKAKINNIKIYVIRNTLLKKSLKKTIFSKLINIIKGPILVGFSMKHPGSASRLFIKFNKKNINFKILNAIYEKKILNIHEIKDLANLPTHIESITKFVILLKEISLGKFIRVLQNITKK